MKIIPPNTDAGIQDGTIATCIKLSTKDGTVFGFTDHDRMLEDSSGTQYIPTPGLSQINMNQRDNAEVSNQELTGAWVIDLDDDDLAAGKFDEAEFLIFMTNWNILTDGYIITDQLTKMKGNTGVLQWSEDGFRVDVHSSMKKLGSSVGSVTTAQCRHLLFGQFIGDMDDGGSAAFTFSGTVGTVTSPKLKFAITLDALGKGDGYYSGGKINFTSGNNAGISFNVKSHLAEELTLYLPANYVITEGDTFTVSTGCDKSIDTCKAKFNNVVNFGGFPHVTNEANFK